MVKRLVSIVLLLLAAVLLYLLFWPVPISPAAWSPATAPPLSGDYEKNSRLANVQRLSLGAGFAPEDVAIDSENRIYAGLDDGRIMRLQADGTRPEVFANTQGRPLGMKFDSHGNLVLADANKGLLSISRDGSIIVLSTQADGVAFACTNESRHRRRWNDLLHRCFEQVSLVNLQGRYSRASTKRTAAHLRADDKNYACGFARSALCERGSDKSRPNFRACKRDRTLPTTSDLAQRSEAGSVRYLHRQPARLSRWTFLKRQGQVLVGTGHAARCNFRQVTAASLPEKNRISPAGISSARTEALFICARTRSEWARS